MRSNPFPGRRRQVPSSPATDTGITGTAELESALAPYLVLLRDFRDGRIAPPEFETRYLQDYLGDPTQWSSELFDVLDGLFFDVDDYVEDDGPRERPGGLDAAQLRQAVTTALAKLEARRRLGPGDTGAGTHP